MCVCEKEREQNFNKLGKREDKANEEMHKKKRKNEETHQKVQNRSSGEGTPDARSAQAPVLVLLPFLRLLLLPPLMALTGISHLNWSENGQILPNSGQNLSTIVYYENPERSAKQTARDRDCEREIEMHGQSREIVTWRERERKSQEKRILPCTRSAIKRGKGQVSAGCSLGR